MDTALLIIGAGPFGLAMAAYARHLNIDHIVVGKPMDFWKTHMPQGMLLRSACDWHLDPLNIHTINCYLQEQALTPQDVAPLSLAFYLNYARWFQEKKQIEVLPLLVERLDFDAPYFTALLDNGQAIRAKNVVCAVGFLYFKNIPPEYTALFPQGSYSHTCDLIDFAPLRGKRCLIVGGRQSAFEWAALLLEQGAAEVHLSHRHDSPVFQPSDWSWVTPLIERMVERPEWYRRLPPEEKTALGQRFWGEGRLKLEPWLEPRTSVARLWPRSRVVVCRRLHGGDLEISLDSGTTLTVDHVILATGYQVNIKQIPFLAAGNILPGLATNNGFPVLDPHFQSTLPGLFFTSMAAVQDFGPFFGFTVSVRTSAQLIGQALAMSISPNPLS